MKNLIIAVRMFLLLTVITGLIYPLLMTGLGQVFFPRQANGSPVELDGRVVGSALVAQKFTQARYFQPRPSAADYATRPSGASNKSPDSKKLIAAVDERKKAGAAAEGLFASGSGLDPDISPANALAQLPRVLAARGLGQADRAALEKLVQDSVQAPDLGFLGRERVNVTLLNLALDEQFPPRAGAEGSNQ